MIIEKLKKFLKEKSEMISVNASSNPPKKYTMSDVYAAAIQQLKTEVQAMKGKPLTAEENLKMEQLAKSVSREVIRDMKI